MVGTPATTAVEVEEGMMKAGGVWSSADEVHGHQMKDDVREDEVRKSSLGGDAHEVHLVLRVCL